MHHLCLKLNHQIKNVKFYFLLIAILPIFSCKKRRDEPQPTEGIVKGTVYTNTNGYKEIHGADITLEDTTKSLYNKKKHHSLKDGTFWIGDVSPNDYDITVEHSQYEHYASKISVKAGDQTNHSVALKPIAPILSLANGIENLDFGLTTNSLTFTIENVGIDTLKWKLVFEEESWFTVNVLEGTGSVEIIVTINREELLEGTYESEVIVKNKEFDEDADTIDIHVASENKLISLKPGADEGKDALAILNSRYYSEISINHPHSTALLLSQWTHSGVLTPTISIIEFTELKSLTNVNVLKAELIFHDGSDLINDNDTPLTDTEVNGYDNDNTIIIYPITEEWVEEGINGSNLPSYSTNFQAKIPRNNDRLALKIADVTTMVQEMIDNPDSYHGFYLSCKIQSFYRSMVLASSDAPNPDEHPELRITYLDK